MFVLTEPMFFGMEWKDYKTHAVQNRLILYKDVKIQNRLILYKDVKINDPLLEKMGCSNLMAGKFSRWLVERDCNTDGSNGLVDTIWTLWQFELGYCLEGYEEKLGIFIIDCFKKLEKDNEEQERRISKK